MYPPDGPSSWGWWLLQLGTPLVLLVGVPGNILSFIVMKSRRFRNKSYSHYLSTLAIFDSLVLIGKFVEQVDSLMQVTGHASMEAKYSDAFCKISNFAEHVCYLMSAWLVLAMTVERFIAVLFPFKKGAFCKPKNAITVILVIFAVMSYSQIFRLIVYEKSGSRCNVADGSRQVYLALHIYLYQLVLLFIVPALMILVCNLAILYKIRRLRYSVQRHGTSHSMQAYSKRHKTTIMLLIVSFAYVVTILPHLLLSIAGHVAIEINALEGLKVLRKTFEVSRVFELLSLINFGSNFYIYVMSGAQFRYQLRYICSKHYSIVSSPPNTEKVFQFKRPASS